MWTVLVGENGLCKTSILQAIALASLGADSANGFPEIIPSLPDRRKPRRAVQVRAEFDFGSVRHTQRVYPSFASPPRSAPRLFSLVEIAPGWAFFQGTSHYIDRVDQRPAGHGGDGREDRDP